MSCNTTAAAATSTQQQQQQQQQQQRQRQQQQQQRTVTVMHHHLGGVARSWTGSWSLLFENYCMSPGPKSLQPARGAGSEGDDSQ